jgi:hypothetical protein
MIASRSARASFTLKRGMLTILLGVLTAALMMAQQPTASQTRAVLARLGKEADRFERNAHRFTCTETLRQTQPDGTRFGTGPRGITTKLPGVVHEIVSEYGYVSVDQPGGSLKEVRLILTVDGLKWKHGKKDLSDLAERIGTKDAKNQAHTLENYEDYGLRGFLSDAGQLILLFARRGVEKYDLVYDRTDVSPSGAAWVYKYTQLDGPQALTIYGAKQPVRQRLAGEVWVQSSDSQLVRITMHSEHIMNASKVRDVTLVDYEPSQWGVLLPFHIDHRQYVDMQLFVIDEFSYAGCRQTLPGKLR